MNILFLDIDGPMIPSYMWVVETEINPSFGRIFSPVAVALVNKFCEVSNSQIVFNSYHNKSTRTKTLTDGIDENIREAAIRNNIKEELIHKDWKTNYPLLPHRDIAIKQWLGDHHDVTKYVAFDDEDFNDPNLVVIDYDVGIKTPQFNAALKLHGIPPLRIM